MYVCACWHVQAVVHTKAHILGQAGKLLGQVLDQVEGTIDISLHLRRMSYSSFQAMPEEKLSMVHNFEVTMLIILMWVLLGIAGTNIQLR